VADEVAARERLPVRFHLQAGLFEQTRDWFATSLLQSNRNLVRILRARGYDFHYSEYVGGHTIGCWTATLPAALEWLLGGPRPA
jgi:enterochelin esterase-like enzyme